MAKHHTTLVAVLVLAVTASVANGLNIQPMVAVDMIDSLLRSSGSMQGSPQQNKVCFDTYTPTLTELADTYKAEYDQCVNSGNMAKEAIIKEVAGNVASITQWRNEICNGYTNCENSEPFPFFACNNREASNAVTKSFNIQNMSKDRMQYVQLRNEMIEYDAKACTDKSTVTYNVNSKEIYDLLQACLSGQTTTVAPVQSTTVAAH